MSAPLQAKSPRVRIAAFRSLVDVVVLDRSRHVKCDELNPICQKCLVGGFECIYQSLVCSRKRTLHRVIAPKGRVIAKPSIALLAKHYSSTICLTLKSPQASSFDHEAQYQYFRFFLNKNASLLSG
ncbi:uncharacterized protein EAF01_001497 [Botrytis porri]|uniref:uncharacterized protein n=1 Tax=Botrytis porri TaxID=87229 RepID=UPI0018FF426D|nr:uncharacterized protein EAF01_001497 [Botrytis porri]KAF7912476.1 hypothetical protein EAF01_001497 [Botrytis porri]